jgi:hypothetical protein
MNIKKNILSLVVSSCLVISLPVYAQGPGNGPGFGSTTNPGTGTTQAINNCQLDPNTSNILSDEVKQQLQFMGEEEKLARDVYVYLEGLWNNNVFANIAKAEQIHIDSVSKFLEAYNIPNLAPEAYGVFTNASLQALYDSLIVKGSLSVTEALMVGALIEEVDISDLYTSIAEANDQAIIQMYTGLLNGSYNHLRAFVDQLKNQGQTTYLSQGYLSQENIDSILSGINVDAQPNTTLAVDASGAVISSASCIYNQIIKDSKISVNNAEFKSNDIIELSSRFKISEQDQGKNAKIVVAFSYTSDAGQLYLFTKDQDSWKTWNGNINSMTFAQQLSLAAEQNIQLFTGQLGDNTGKYVLSLGYILDDGSFIYNIEPMSFTIQE